MTGPVRFETALATRLRGLNERVRELARARPPRRGRGGAVAALRDEIAVLRVDLARVTLVSTALVQAVLRKELLTAEELGALANEMDLLDGIADGLLDPAALRPDAPAADPGAAAAPREPRRRRRVRS